MDGQCDPDVRSPDRAVDILPGQCAQGQCPSDPWPPRRDSASRIRHQQGHDHPHRQMMYSLSATAGIVLLLVGVAAAELPPNPRVKGERVFLKCYSCHALDPAVINVAGPHLSRIFGRPTASLRGFAYSESMRRFARANRHWNRTLLDRYIADPQGVVPGTSMAFPGIRDARERKELLDYLATRRQRPLWHFSRPIGLLESTRAHPPIDRP